MRPRRKEFRPRADDSRYRHLDGQPFEILGIHRHGEDGNDTGTTMYRVRVGSSDIVVAFEDEVFDTSGTG
jgi:hypothetical protein